MQEEKTIPVPSGSAILSIHITFVKTYLINFSYFILTKNASMCKMRSHIGSLHLIRTYDDQHAACALELGYHMYVHQ
jgi:hypothetical protein